MRLYNRDQDQIKRGTAARQNVNAIEHFAGFEHLGFFAGWLVSALVLGFLLFYAWDLIHRRLERKQDVDLQI